MADTTITDETRSITLTVSGAPDMPVTYTKMTIAPARVVFTYRWTKTGGLYSTSVEVSGPRRLKAGNLSEVWAEDKYVSPKDWPAWVAELAATNEPRDWAGSAV